MALRYPGEVAHGTITRKHNDYIFLDHALKGRKDATIDDNDEFDEDSDKISKFSSGEVI